MKKIFSIKRFILPIGAILILAALTCFNIHTDSAYTYEKDLKVRLNNMLLNTYYNSNYDYAVKYPHFFRASERIYSSKDGHAYFHYLDIGLESFVQIYRGTTQQLAQKLMQNYFKGKCKMGKDSFTISGYPFNETTSKEAKERITNGEKIYAKYVKRGKLWYCYQLSYPDNYEPYIDRLFAIVNRWTPFENKNNNIYQLPAY